MKKLLLGLMFLTALNSYAQDTVKKSNTIGKFNEEFMVLKSDKSVKQGSYKLYTDKKLVASGAYNQGKRTGTWSFYNNGVLAQQYDYTTNKIISDIPDKNISCDIDDTAPGDAVTKAIKIGGYQGFCYLAAAANFDAEASGSGLTKLTHVFTVDANGKITGWAASVYNADGFKIVHPVFTELPPDVAQIIPAVLNGQKIACTITVHIVQSGDEHEDFKFGQDAAKQRGGKKGGKNSTPY
jgi:hypothetical protein